MVTFIIAISNTSNMLTGIIKQSIALLIFWVKFRGASWDEIHKGIQEGIVESWRKENNTFICPN